MSDPKVPTTPPIVRSFDFGSLVRKLWGDGWHAHEKVYKFRNGRTFESSDYGTSGIYRGTS